MTKPIVVGIDGSPESFAAADWAGREAVRRNLPVHLLNVWQNPVGNVQFSPDPDALRFWEEIRVRETGKRLTDRHPALSVTMQQVYGTPVKELLDAAAGSEMMVLGSRGLGGAGAFFHGSVGLHVVARSDRPVVVVRSAEPPESSGRGRGKVVLGLDLGHACDPLVSFAFEEAAAREAVLHAIHVWGEARLYSYAAPAMDARLAADLRAERGHELAQTLAPWHAKFPQVTLEESIIEGQVAQRLIEAAKGTDLLAVGRRRHHPPTAVRLGPIAHAVLHHVACPVTVVPHD